MSFSVNELITSFDAGSLVAAVIFSETVKNIGGPARAGGEALLRSVLARLLQSKILMGQLASVPDGAKSLVSVGLVSAVWAYMKKMNLASGVVSGVLIDQFGESLVRSLNFGDVSVIGAIRGGNLDGAGVGNG